jgi:hypothetical protein
LCFPYKITIYIPYINYKKKITIHKKENDVLYHSKTILDVL